jgi:hypothetical protein
MCIKVKSRIRIRIQVKCRVLILNTDFKDFRAPGEASAFYGKSMKILSNCLHSINEWAGGGLTWTPGAPSQGADSSSYCFGNRNAWSLSPAVVSAPGFLKEN